MIGAIWGAIRAPFAWRTLKIAGAWAYQENEITGRRRIVRNSWGYSPIDLAWLEGGRDRA